MVQLVAPRVYGHAANQSGPKTYFKVNRSHACGGVFQRLRAVQGSSVRVSGGAEVGEGQDLYFCVFPSGLPIAFARFPCRAFLAPVASANAPCATPAATPFMSGMKWGFDIVPSMAKGMPPLPLPSVA